MTQCAAVSAAVAPNGTAAACARPGRDLTSAVCARRHAGIPLLVGAAAPALLAALLIVLASATAARATCLPNSFDGQFHGCFTPSPAPRPIPPAPQPSGNGPSPYTQAWQDAVEAYNRGDYQTALQLFQRAAQGIPNNATLIFEIDKAQGMVAWHAGNLQLALNWFTRAGDTACANCTMNPDIIPRLRAAIAAQQQQRQTEEQQRELQNAITQLLRAGDDAFNHADYQQALNLYLAAAGKGANSPALNTAIQRAKGGVLNKEGNAEAKKGNLDAAIHDYQLAIGLVGNDANVLGNLQLAKQRQAEALKQQAEALQRQAAAKNVNSIISNYRPVASSLALDQARSAGPSPNCVYDGRPGPCAAPVDLPDPNIKIIATQTVYTAKQQAALNRDKVWVGLQREQKQAEQDAQQHQAKVDKLEQQYASADPVEKGFVSVQLAAEEQAVTDAKSRSDTAKVKADDEAKTVIEKMVLDPN